MNDDQKAAIAKYEEVVQNLEFSRDLSNQFKTLAIDEDKARKKQAKKETQEKAKNETKKVTAVLEMQVSNIKECLVLLPLGQCSATFRPCGPHGRKAKALRARQVKKYISRCAGEASPKKSAAPRRKIRNSSSRADGRPVKFEIFSQISRVF